MVKVHKGLFCELAIEAGFLDRSSMVQALKIQYELSKKQQYTKIGTICAENGLMTVPQIIEILERQNVFVYECSACGRQYNIAFANPRLNYYCLRDDEILHKVNPETARKVKVDGIIHFSMGFPGGLKPEAKPEFTPAEQVAKPKSEGITNGLTKTKFNVKQVQLDSERLKKPTKDLKPEESETVSRRARVQLDSKILAAMDKGERSASMRKVTMSRNVEEREFEVKPDKVDPAQINAYKLLTINLADSTAVQYIDSEFKQLEENEAMIQTESEIDISDMVSKAVNRVERQLESLESEELESDVFDLDTEQGEKLLADDEIESDRMILMESVQSDLVVPTIDIEEEIDDVESEQQEPEADFNDDFEADDEDSENYEIKLNTDDADESESEEESEDFEFDVDMIREKAGLDSFDEENEEDGFDDDFIDDITEHFEVEEAPHVKQSMGEILSDDLIEKIRETQREERANVEEITDESALNDSDILSENDEFEEAREAIKSLDEMDDEADDISDEKALLDVNDAEYIPPETDETEFSISTKDAADFEEPEIDEDKIIPTDSDTLLEIKHQTKTIDDPGTDVDEAAEDAEESDESDSEETSEEDDELPFDERQGEINAEIVQAEIAASLESNESESIENLTTERKKSPFDKEFDPPSDFEPETETMELYPGDEKDLLWDEKATSADTDEALNRLKSIEEEDLESELDSEATDLREILKSASSELFFREENDYEDIEFDIDALDEMLNGDLKEAGFGFLQKSEEKDSILNKVLLDDSDLERTDLIQLPDRFNMQKDSVLGPPDDPYEEYEPDVEIPKSRLGNFDEKLRDFREKTFAEDEDVNTDEADDI